MAQGLRVERGDLLTAIDRADAGQVAATLGGGLVKLRVARPGGGGRGGYRTIVAMRVKERAIFLEGYAKNATADTPRAILAVHKLYGKSFQALDDAQVDEIARRGEVREIG